ncbi:MAG: SDR family oxidoreductase [Candidatus Hydrogenedentes bacterium]|nr:SDR family oxidoreductase [Candidatus Hydrogenedentota bacterium]
MTTYLVTGGAGFIGSNLVEYLSEAGVRVRVLDNCSTGKLENLASMSGKYEFVKGDIRNPDTCRQAVEGVDFVLHHAAVPSVPRSVSDPLVSHEANATGTLNLLVAARESKVRRFINISSSSVYGNQPGGSRCESMMLSPLSPYAASKAAAEHYVRAFSECYGLEAVSLRYFNVFGPRQDPNSQYSAVIPLFISAVMRGEPPTIHGDGQQSRDFTYVENNVRACVLAATASIAARGQVYNIACGESTSVLSLATAIIEALDSKVQPRFVAARVGDVRTSCADIWRAREDLGYEVRVPFREGLAKTVAWYAKFP